MDRRAAATRLRSVSGSPVADGRVHGRAATSTGSNVCGQHGRMHPVGLAEVERATADGRWAAAYAGSASIEVPDDFATALAKEPTAQAAFDSLSRTKRFAILYRIGGAKKPETRARRIEQLVAMLTRGETIYPQRSADS